MARQSAINLYRRARRAGANSSRRALVTCVSSSAPPCGAREVRVRQPGHGPGCSVAKPSRTHSFTALVNHTAQVPPPRQSALVVRCRPRNSSPAMRLRPPVVRRELDHETDGYATYPDFGLRAGTRRREPRRPYLCGIEAGRDFSRWTAHRLVSCRPGFTANRPPG